MGDKTKIGWTSSTWNPIRGCRRTAPAGSRQSGCGDPTGGGCYAERHAARFCGPGEAYDGLIKLTANGPRWSGEVRTVQKHLMDPLRWRRPRRIFTDSMSDLFYEGFSDGDIDRVVAVMMICSTHETRGGHIFQTLTKRPARMRAYLSDPKTLERVAGVAGTLMEDGDGWYDSIAFRPEGLVDPHLWWGTSVENQAAADERIPEILATPAAVRFLSCEPLIGPVDLSVPRSTALVGATARKILRDHGARGAIPAHLQPPPSLDWVIVGCESGPGARTCEVEWLRSIRDVCARSEVPFFLKQAFESAEAQVTEGPDEPGGFPPIAFGDGTDRKGASGTLLELPYLDGVQHAAFPEVLPWPT